MQVHEIKKAIKEKEKENQLIFGKMYSDSEDEEQKLDKGTNSNSKVKKSLNRDKTVTVMLALQDVTKNRLEGRMIMILIYLHQEKVNLRIREAKVTILINRHQGKIKKHKN